MGITNFSNDQNNQVNGKFGSREEAKSKKEYIRGIFGGSCRIKFIYFQFTSKYKTLKAER